MSRATWADTFLVFCDDKRHLGEMICEVIEELLFLDMEPEPKSLGLICADEPESKEDLTVRNKEKMLRM